MNKSIGLALFLISFFVYVQAGSFDFVNFDDPAYVSQNPHVREGLTSDSVKWAVTSTEAANWFPVTRLSHILDAWFFSMRAGSHHLTSVFLHALAAVFLFVFLKRATRARWPSAFVAFVFAMHPLHVESVAWVSERKDVLCALFWFLTLWAYVRYTERPARGRYLLTLLPFCLGLMAKPMIVTLPLLLLLLDYWPLRRTPYTHSPTALPNRDRKGGARSVSLSGSLLREKIPFFALSAAAAIVTFLVQQQGGAVRAIDAFPLGLRLENALVSTVVYLGQMCWPARLAAFYPYPSSIPLWEPLLAALILAAVSWLVVRKARAWPWAAFGWCWYLITLAPVIGLVQVGAQAHADRYMYVPMVGPLIALAWGAAAAGRAAAITACAAGLACAAVTWFQIPHWKDSEALFTHAIAVTDGNYLAEHNLGTALLEKPGRLPDAVAHLEASLQIRPDSVSTLTDLGNALMKMPGRESDAIDHYRSAIRLDPDSPIPHEDLAGALAAVPGRLPEAINEYRAALRLAPEMVEAHSNLGRALARLGRPEEAVAEYEAVLGIRPDDSETRNNLAAALANDPARLPEAIAQYEAALRSDPDSADSHYNLALALSKSDTRLPEAIAQFEAALRIKPDYAEAHSHLGVILSRDPARMADAIAHFEAALRIHPDDADAHYNLGVAYSSMPGRLTQAIAQFEEAERLRPDPETQQIIRRLRPQ